MEFEKFYLVTAYIPNAGAKLDRLDYRVKDYDVAFHSFIKKSTKYTKMKFLILP